MANDPLPVARTLFCCAVAGGAVLLAALWATWRWLLR